MNKLYRLIKRRLALILVLLFSIESFAAVVGDNDGAAFITKAEFDSMKNDFQSQLDRYNSSLDNKIDGAIAAYLAGVKTSKQTSVVNALSSVRLADGQYVSDMIWTKKSNYRVNPNDFTNGDTQWIAQSAMFYSSAAYPGETKTQKIDYRKVASTSEPRIEINSNEQVVAWGEYSCAITGVAFQFDDTGLRTSASTGFYFTSPTDNIAKPMRKVGKLVWTCFHHWGKFNARWQTSGRTGLAYPEGSWVKCDENMPSDLTAFDLNLCRIGPLATLMESTVPPSLKDSDPDIQMCGDDNHFGNWCRSDGLQNITETLALQPDEVTITFGKMDYADESSTNTTIEGRMVRNLSARWFKLIAYNNLSLKAVDDKFGLVCKFKAGLPLTTEATYLADDILQFNVSNIAEDGYLIFYVSKEPDDSWGGNKNNYAVEKWKLTKDNDKKIEISLDSKMTGSVFVVWLPDVDCKLPTIDIYKIG